MLAPLAGIGDSLMCGLEGYDIVPEQSFFAHLSRGAGQSLDLPRVRWNFAPFRELAHRRADSLAAARAIAVLRSHTIELTVEHAPPLRHLFAAPGFPARWLSWAHEETRGLPHHLRLLARPFLNPLGATPASALERALCAGPAASYILWLGGVDWVSNLLGARRRLPKLGQRLASQIRHLILRLGAAHRAAGWAAPRFILGGLVDPLRLPLVSPCGRGGLTFAFLPERQEPVLTATEGSEIRRAVAALNLELAQFMHDLDGVFVDLDAHFARARDEAEVRGDGWSVPTEHLISADLVHPTATGHAVIAHWFRDAIVRELGADLEPPDVATIWRAEKARLEARDPEAARPLVRALYEEFLYRPNTESTAETGEDRLAKRAA